ncbi:MAG: hypothetical protein P8I99_08280 [Acidimicrobiales bacterium]|nr:hypothetical protein [Acidimicrobiales bacterium]MDG1877397.1 hypothetical protein [Acidimicrobiales bacterium]
MAFGQSAGPAASHRQVAELLGLLQNAGHADFKDARGPLGFNQRQAAGRFTADEAAELIDQLQEVEHQAAQHADTTVPAEPTSEAQTNVQAEAARSGMSDEARAEMERAVRTASTKSLVLEVRRRGWTVTKPKS